MTAEPAPSIVVASALMDVERLFAEFCRTREPGLLGEVFDACADDLFAVALHLCRDRVDAEDLVQATFLVAIARAHRWQPERPLRPWLLGILHREARQLRRRSRRTVDAARVNVPPPPEPPQLVLAAETHTVVAAAIPALPQPYRDVLELHLVQALAPGAIAERLQRSPGAVRTQLWRGLELLRGVLPKGLAVGLAAELSSRAPALAPLAAVRAKVLAAATSRSAAVASGTGAVVLGGILMSKLLVAAAAIAAAAVLWWNWPAADIAPRAEDVAASSSPAPATAAALPTDAPAREIVADAVAPRAEAKSPARSAPGTTVPAAATPMEVAVVVVDGRGSPVADATVTVFDRAVRVEQDGSSKPTDRRTEAPPREIWRTDDVGRTRVAIVDECLVSADKEGLGWSGDMRLSASEQRLPAELRLVLQPLATVRGRVLSPDGSPAADAVIDAYQQGGWAVGSRTLPITGCVPRARTDADGRFVLRVVARELTQLTAKHGGRYVRGNVDAMNPGDETEIALRFPGAFSVRGVLTDTAGQPLQGSVRLLGSGPPASRLFSEVKCDALGTFEFPLAAADALVVVGGVDGQTSARADLVVDAARPHANITLRTSPFVEVDGRVVDERNEPIPAAWVGLNYIVERDAVHEQRSNLHGILPRGPTDAHGAFRFRVPAGYRYCIVARAIPDNTDLYVNGPEFTAPATGVVVVVRDSDKQGFVVAGRIVAASDGSPITGVRIERQTITERNASSDAAGASTDGTFRVGPFAIGHRYAFAFEADGFARTIVGPFDATLRTEEVVVRIPRCGTVRCRVLRADGTPAAGAFVALGRERERDPFGRAWQGEADQDGCIRFTEVVPGAYKVHARATVKGERGASTDTVVHPEQESSVKIVLLN